MIDEIFDRGYQHSRTALNAGIGQAVAGLGRSAMQAFRILDAIQFSAPWSEPKRRVARDA